MKFVKRLLGVLLMLMLIAIGVWVGVDNQNLITFYLLGFSLGEMPVGLWMLSALSIGVMFGLLVTVPTVFRLRHKNSSLIKRLQKASQESSQGGSGQ